MNAIFEHHQVEIEKYAVIFITQVSHREVLHGLLGDLVSSLAIILSFLVWLL